MPYNLFLDDERLPSDITWLDYGNIGCWHTIRTFEQFKQAIDHCMPEYISFDHDIACWDEQGKVTIKLIRRMNK